MTQKCNGHLHVVWFAWEGSPSQKMFKSTNVDLNILWTYSPYSCKHQQIQPKKRCIFRGFHRFVSEFGGQIVGLIPLSLSAMTMKFTQIFILEERLIEIIWNYCPLSVWATELSGNHKNSCLSCTVGGRNPKQPPGMLLKPCKKHGINYQPQLVT